VVFSRYQKGSIQLNLFQYLEKGRIRKLKKFCKQQDVAKKPQVFFRGEEIGA